MSKPSEQPGLPNALFEVATLLAMLAAIGAIFLYVPDDALQGPVQRIFYVHLAMWLSTTYPAFAVFGVASMLYLWTREPQWDRLGHAAAELGLLFCTLGLATGSIWAKPAWNVWWTWDARLTFSMILWMIYAAYLLLRTLVQNEDLARLLSAIFSASGLAVSYLTYKAVYWWRSIHPAVIVTREGSSGLPDPRMQITLVVTLIAFFLLFLWLMRVRVHTARLQEEAEELRATIVRA